MKKIRLQEGITLIVLIITIIILLILAVVTIGVVKDSGIIKYAQNAASDYTIQQEKELILLGYSEYIINKSTSDSTELKVEGAQVTRAEETGWEVIFNESKHKYQVDGTGNITYEVSEEDKGEENNTDTSIEIDDLIGKTFYGIVYDSKQTILQITDNNNVYVEDKDLTSGTTEPQIMSLPYEYKVEDGTLKLSFSIFDNGAQQDIQFTASVNAITDTNGKIENLYFYAISEELGICQFYSLNDYGITYDLPQTTYLGKNSEGDTKAKFVFNSDNKTVDYYSSIDSNGNFTSDYETKTYFIINNEIVINFDHTNMILKLKVQIIEDWFLQSDSIG